MDLLAACLRQKDLCFTNFTPTAAVAKMLRLLRFKELNTDELIVPHLPVLPGAMKLEVLTRRQQFDQRLTNWSVPCATSSGATTTTSSG